MANSIDNSTLLLLAEKEMRRSLPRDVFLGKRQKLDGKDYKPAEEVGRFDYSAVAQLAAGGLAGFLLTCNFRKEKTAIKEASQVLLQYIRSKPTAEDAEECSAQPVDHKDAAQSCKPLFSIVKLGCRGVVMLKYNGEKAVNALHRQDGQDVVKAAVVDDGQRQAAQQQSHNARVVVEAVGSLLSDINSSKRKRMQHCQRIVPIQACCLLEVAALQKSVEQLASLVAVQHPAKSSNGVMGDASEPGDSCQGQSGDYLASESSRRPGNCLSFAVAYKPRGGDEGIRKGPTTEISEAQTKQKQHDYGAQSAGAELTSNIKRKSHQPGCDVVESGRLAVIHSVAGGFEIALKERYGLQAKVDLKSPEWVILVEALPVMGSIYAALSVLPSSMCVLKPRLQMRPVGPVSQEKHTPKFL